MLNSREPSPGRWGTKAQNTSSGAFQRIQHGWPYEGRFQLLTRKNQSKAALLMSKERTKQRHLGRLESDLLHLGVNQQKRGKPDYIRKMIYK